MDGLRQEMVDTGSARLQVTVAGPEEGPLLILLHGFPEYWYGWRQQIEPLAAAGYRLWIPDQRGYNQSDRPQEIPAYNLDLLADDVEALIAAAGEQRATVIGHDWGGAVAWWLANRSPERLERLIVLNVPHHAVMRRHMSRNPRQIARSFYMLFFQLPWLPERLLAGRNNAGLEWILRASSRSDTFSAEDIARYNEAWSQPGALTGMINWYRAVFREPPRSVGTVRIKVPTLLIWGMKDVALRAQMASDSMELCDDGRLELIPEATHWVQHDAPERVNDLILDFLKAAE